MVSEEEKGRVKDGSYKEEKGGVQDDPVSIIRRGGLCGLFNYMSTNLPRRSREICGHVNGVKSRNIQE